MYSPLTSQLPQVITKVYITMITKSNYGESVINRITNFLTAKKFLTAFNDISNRSNKKRIVQNNTLLILLFFALSIGDTLQENQIHKKNTIEAGIQVTVNKKSPRDSSSHTMINGGTVSLPYINWESEKSIISHEFAPILLCKVLDLEISVDPVFWEDSTVGARLSVKKFLYKLNKPYTPEYQSYNIPPTLEVKNIDTIIINDGCYGIKKDQWVVLFVSGHNQKLAIHPIDGGNFNGGIVMDTVDKEYISLVEKFYNSSQSEKNCLLKIKSNQKIFTRYSSMNLKALLFDNKILNEINQIAAYKKTIKSKDINKRTKALFLDIDGVMNGGSGKKMENPERFQELLSLYKDRQYQNIELYMIDSFYRWDRKAVKRVQYLCEKMDAKIVLSSTWRLGSSLEELKLLFDFHNLGEYLVGKTASLSEGRAEEVALYLKQNPEISQFVIIDDLYEDLFYEKYPHNFAHCINNSFDEERFEIAKRLLK